MFFIGLILERKTIFNLPFFFLFFLSSILFKFLTFIGKSPTICMELFFNFLLDKISLNSFFPDACQFIFLNIPNRLVTKMYIFFLKYLILSAAFENSPLGAITHGL